MYLLLENGSDSPAIAMLVSAGGRTNLQIPLVQKSIQKQFPALELESMQRMGFWQSCKLCDIQGGPLLVIYGVRTHIGRVITPVT